MCSKWSESRIHVALILSLKTSSSGHLYRMVESKQWLFLKVLHLFSLHVFLELVLYLNVGGNTLYTLIVWFLLYRLSHINLSLLAKIVDTRLVHYLQLYMLIGVIIDVFFFRIIICASFTFAATQIGLNLVVLFKVRGLIRWTFDFLFILTKSLHTIWDCVNTTHVQHILVWLRILQWIYFLLRVHFKI